MDTSLPVTLRPAYADDAIALERLAVLDSATVPPGRLLVAEVEGELWAALAPERGAVIADPFRSTAPLVALLRARAATASPRRRDRRAVLRPLRAG